MEHKFNPNPTPVLKTRGRGAMENPAGRFERFTSEADGDALDLPVEEEFACETPFKTELYKDPTRRIISTNDSPDVGMDTSLNPYRGCEHGCIYCFARPTHEYLGLSVGLDFESKIFVKEDAPRLLEKELSAKSWQPRPIFMSGATDPYQPTERKLQVTRRCLEVFAAFRNPVGIITKNNLVSRDADLLGELAGYGAGMVNMSMTTLDRSLARNMEPRASTPPMRLKAIETLTKAGVPVNVMLGPVLPGLTEHEIPALLQAAADAGAVSAGWTMLRLPYGVKDIFQTWLREYYPDRADKVLNRVKDMRGGKLNDPRFGSRLRGEGFFAEQIGQIFKAARQKAGLTKDIELSAAHFRVPGRAQQLELF